MSTQKMLSREYDVIGSAFDLTFEIELARGKEKRI